MDELYDVVFPYFVIFHLKSEFLPCSPKCHNDIWLNILTCKPILQETNVSALSVWCFNVSHWASVQQHLWSLCTWEMVILYCSWRTDGKAVKFSCFMGVSGWCVNFKKCVDLSPTLFTYLSPSIPLLSELLLASQASDQSGLFLSLLLLSWETLNIPTACLYCKRGGRPVPSFSSFTFVIIGPKSSTGAYLGSFRSYFYMNPGTCFHFSCITVVLCRSLSSLVTHVNG